MFSKLINEEISKKSLCIPLNSMQYKNKIS
jgi:hypothetical protein